MAAGSGSVLSDLLARKANVPVTRKAAPWGAMLPARPAGSPAHESKSPLQPPISEQPGRQLQVQSPSRSAPVDQSFRGSVHEAKRMVQEWAARAPDPQEITALTEHLAALDSASSSQAWGMSVLRQRNEELEASNAKLQEVTRQLQDSRSQVSKFQTNITELEQQLKECEVERDKQSERADKTQKKLGVVKHAYKQAAYKHENTNQELQDTRAQIRKLETSQKELLLQVETLQDENRTFRSDLQVSEMQLEAAKSELSQAGDEETRLAKQSSLLRHEAAELRHLLQQEQHANASAQKDSKTRGTELARSHKYLAELWAICRDNGPSEVKCPQEESMPAVQESGTSGSGIFGIFGLGGGQVATAGPAAPVATSETMVFCFFDRKPGYICVLPMWVWFQPCTDTASPFCVPTSAIAATRVRSAKTEAARSLKYTVLLTVGGVRIESVVELDDHRKSVLAALEAQEAVGLADDEDDDDDDDDDQSTDSGMARQRVERFEFYEMAGAIRLTRMVRQAFRQVGRLVHRDTGLCIRPVEPVEAGARMQLSKLKGEDTSWSHFSVFGGLIRHESSGLFLDVKAKANDTELELSKDESVAAWQLGNGHIFWSESYIVHALGGKPKPGATLVIHSDGIGQSRTKFDFVLL